MEKLYTIISNEQIGEDFIFNIEINAQHNIFKGHFPNNPILPGACTIEIIKELAKYTIKRELMLSTISVCKFISFISPLDPCLEFIIKILPDNSLQASVLQNSELKLKLKSKIKVSNE